MLRYRLIAFAFWSLVRLPGWLAYGFAACAAEVAFRVNRAGREVAEANVRRPLGRRATAAAVRRAARGCFRAAAYYYTDLARTPLLDPDRFEREQLRDFGFEHVRAALAAGRGAIVATIHYGNPELVAQSMKARGLTFLAFTEPLEPPPLAALVQQLRSSQGLLFVPVSRSALKQAIRHLRGGGVVCIVIDRDIQHAGTPVCFFGATAELPTGAVELARHTGAALIPALTRRRGWRRFDLYVQPPLPLVVTKRPEVDSQVNAERLIGCFEPYLRRDPSQWFVLEEPIWEADRRDTRTEPPESVSAGAGTAEAQREQRSQR